MNPLEPNIYAERDVRKSKQILKCLNECREKVNLLFCLPHLIRDQRCKSDNEKACSEFENLLHFSWRSCNVIARDSNRNIFSCADASNCINYWYQNCAPELAEYADRISTPGLIFLSEIMQLIEHFVEIMDTINFLEDYEISDEKRVMVRDVRDRLLEMKISVDTRLARIVGASEREMMRTQKRNDRSISVAEKRINCLRNEFEQLQLNCSQAYTSRQEEVLKMQARVTSGIEQYELDVGKVRREFFKVEDETAEHTKAAELLLTQIDEQSAMFEEASEFYKSVRQHKTQLFSENRAAKIIQRAYRATVEKLSKQKIMDRKKGVKKDGKKGNRKKGSKRKV